MLEGHTPPDEPDSGDGRDEQPSVQPTEPEHISAPPGRLRRALTILGSGIGLTAVFALSLGAGALLHLDLPAARRVVRTAANNALATTFEGSLVLGDINHLSVIDGLDVTSAVVRDPQGQPVLTIDGLRVRLSALTIAAGALSNREKLDIRIPTVHIDNADVVLDKTAAGDLKIAEAFNPRPSKKPSKPSKPGAKERALVLEIPHVTIGHAWIHGDVAAPRALDADINELVGALKTSPEGLSIDIDETNLTERALLPVQTTGITSAHFTTTNPKPEPTASPAPSSPVPSAKTPGTPPPKSVTKLTADFNGHVGDIEVQTSALLDGDRVEITADIPRAEPAAIAKLAPEVPLKKPVSARARVSGYLPTLEVSASARVYDGEEQPASLEVDGDVLTEPTIRVQAHAAVERIDPTAFGDDLPAAKINALADVELEITDRLRAVAFARTEPIMIEGHIVPALDLHAAIDDKNISGTLDAHEPGMPLRGAFELIPGGARFQASARVPSLRAVPRIAAPVDGAADVAVHGKVQDGRLDATVSGSISNVRAPGDVAVRKAAIHGRVQGPFDALALNASVTGSDLQADRFEFDTFSVQASGPLTSPSVRTSLRSGARDFINASAVVDPTIGGARRVELHVEKSGQGLHARVAKVSTKGGRVTLDGIQGHGDAIEDMKGSLVIAGGDILGKLHAENIDIKRLLDLAEQPALARGRVNIDIDLAKTRRGRDGHASVSLEGGEVAVVSGISSKIDVKFNEEQISSEGFIRVVTEPRDSDREARRCAGEIASLRFSGAGDKVRGPLLSGATWSKVEGSMKAAAEEIDIGCVADLVPGLLPLSEIGGKLTARLTIDREPGQHLPSIREFSARTRGLVIAPKPERGADEPAWASRKIDVNVEGSFDAASRQVNTGLSIFDKDLIADLRAAANLDVEALLARPAQALKLLRSAPIAGHLTIPRRGLKAFSTLPMVKADAIPVSGDVRLDGYFAGTAEKPSIVVRALGWGFQPKITEGRGPDEGRSSSWKMPLDLDTLLTYDSEEARFKAHVTSHRREIVTLNAEATAKLNELLAGAPKDPKKKLWTASAEAKLHDAPLGQIPYLAQNHVDGHLSGTVAIRGLNAAPSVAVDVNVPDLQLGPDLRFDAARVSVHIDPRKAAGRPPLGAAPETSPFRSPNKGLAEVHLASRDGGRLTLIGYAGVVWKDGLVPGPDGGAPADMYLNARRFRLEALQPFVASAVSRLSGSLDGDVRVGFKRVSDEDKPTIEADMALNDGAFYVPRLGQELRGAHARLIATKEGVIRIDDLGASALTGDVKGWALAKVNGMKLENAAAELVIGERDPVPIALEGVPLGTVTGKIMLTAGMRDGAVIAMIRVPKIHVELPPSIGRSVQPLDENPDVIIKQPLGPPKEEEAPSDSSLLTALNVQIDQATIGGPILNLALSTPKTTPVRIEVADKTRIHGDISLLSGYFEVLGKRFEVERGLVHFRGADDPNPFVNATVRWDAPDGTHIFVDYVGTLDPITDEKIHFRSDPAKSKQEIIATLLLGSEYEHGTVAGGGALRSEPQGPRRSTTTAAGGLAAGFIAGQISKLFSDAGIKTSLGTTESGAIKTGLAYEKGSTRTQITYEGAGGGPATRSAAGGTGLGGGSTEVSIDWRFKRDWVVRGMVRIGPDQPSSGLDVLWQYRY